MYSSPSFIRPPLLQSICRLMRGVVSLEGDNLVVFYYLSASESWSDKKDVLWLEGPVARETTALQKKK